MKVIHIFYLLAILFAFVLGKTDSIIERSDIKAFLDSNFSTTLLGAVVGAFTIVYVEWLRNQRRVF